MKAINQIFTVLFLTSMLMYGCESVSDSNPGESNIHSLEFEQAANANNGNGKGNNDDNTIVPGQQTDDGSIPNGTVNGKYKSVYAFDDNGDFYWDLGDGRVQGTVSSIDDLDQSTLSVCNYEVIYRGDFKGDPFLDNGWIRNNIKCSGFAYDNSQTFNYLIVHETDKRYSEDLIPAFGGDWGYHVYAIGGTGNIANPQHPANN